MPSPAGLSVRNLSKSFGEVRALADVSLDVRPGEMVALIGPSGSGKSTLMRVAAGLIAADPGAGRVEACGGTVQARGRVDPRTRRTRARIGFVFQQFNLVGRLSLFTNVALGSLGRIGFWRGLFGLWPAETRTAAMTALARVGIAEAAGRRARTLSGGQQQRGAIARALTQGAEILLADEPVASLDPVAARNVMGILRDLTREDRLAVLVSLHQVDHARRYCDRAVALAGGAVAYDGPVAGLDRNRLAAIYGAEFEEAAAP